MVTDYFEVFVMKKNLLKDFFEEIKGELIILGIILVIIGLSWLGV